jgi:hypothetical protein
MAQTEACAECDCPLSGSEQETEAVTTPTTLDLTTELRRWLESKTDILPGDEVVKVEICDQGVTAHVAQE